MVKLICSKERALNNIEKSAKEATLKDFVKFVKQIEGGGNMKFNVSVEEYGEILKTDKSHRRFLAKMKENGFSLDEKKVKKRAMKSLLSNKEIQEVLKKIGDD